MAEHKRFEVVQLVELEEGLRQLICQNLLETGPSFHVGSDLYEAGLDSMAIMQLLLLVEQRFGLLLPASDLSRENFNSIRSLARLIQSRLAAAQ